MFKICLMSVSLFAMLATGSTVSAAPESAAPACDTCKQHRKQRRKGKKSRSACGCDQCKKAKCDGGKGCACHKGCANVTKHRAPSVDTRRRAVRAKAKPSATSAAKRKRTAHATGKRPALSAERPRRTALVTAKAAKAAKVLARAEQTLVAHGGCLPLVNPGPRLIYSVYQFSFADDFGIRPEGLDTHLP